MSKFFLAFFVIISMVFIGNAYSVQIDSTTLNNNNITSNTTLTNTKGYLLKGFVYVKAGVTLTIQPGTVIYGDKATTGTLIIERGAQINAAGTASQPIIFTSRIAAGQRAPGDWGGVILLGRATINTVTGADTAAIEGIPSGVQSAYYGGHNDADNSGVMRYVRIEFGGINLTGLPNNEINGLTCGGVGNGTTLEYIQVSYSGDDSFEWFGGTVNCKWLISYRCVDDDWDCDNGFSGKVQYGLSVRDKNLFDQSTSNGFEIDNNANSPANFNSPRTKAVFSNMTVVGPKQDTNSSVDPLFGRGAHTRRNNLESIYNSIFMGWPTGVRFDGNGVMGAILADSSQFKANIYAGNWPKLADTAGGNGTVALNGPNYVNANNTVLALNTLVGLTNPFGALPTPSMPPVTVDYWMPATGSAALSGANFTYPNLTNSFFTSGTYRGAFGSTNWTAGWANFNPLNSPSPISVQTISSEVPSAYNLAQNFPNPFNPTTKISFSLVKSGFVTLKIFDVSGKEVASLVNDNLAQGTYSADFNAANLTSGIYFYTLRTNDFSETKKMMLIK